MPPQQCVICLEDLLDPPLNDFLEPNHAVALVCGHIFHLSCITLHHQNQARLPVNPNEHFSLRCTCPSCRATSLTRVRQMWSKGPMYTRLFFDGEGEKEEEIKTAPEVHHAMIVCKRIRHILPLLEFADQSVVQAVLRQDPCVMNEDALQSYRKEAEALLRSLEALKMRADVQANTEALSAALTAFGSRVDLTEAANRAWCQVQATQIRLDALAAEHSASEQVRIDAAVQQAQAAAQEHHESQLRELSAHKDEVYGQQLHTVRSTLTLTERALDQALAEKAELARQVETTEKRVRRQLEGEFMERLTQRQEQWDAHMVKAREEVKQQAEQIASLQEQVAQQRTIAGRLSLKLQNEHADSKKKAKQQAQAHKAAIEEKQLELQALQQRLDRLSVSRQTVNPRPADESPLRRGRTTTTTNDLSLEVTLPGLDDSLSQAHKPSKDAHPTRRTFDFTLKPNATESNTKAAPLAFQHNATPEKPVFSIGASDPKPRSSSLFARAGLRHAAPASQRRAGLKPANSHVDAFGKPLPNLAHGPKRLIKS